MHKTSTYTLRTYTAGASSVLSSRLSNDFRLHYSSNQVTDLTVIDMFGGSAPVDLAQLSGLGAGSDVSATPCFGSGCDTLEQLQQSGAQRQWNLVDTVNLSLALHQVKLGVDYRRLAPVATVASPFVGYFYSSESEVLANNASFASAGAVAPAYPLYTNFSAFAQDEWRVSNRLNLSLGVRWEVNPPPGVTQGLKPFAFQGSSPNTFTLAPQGTPLWKTTWFNFAPRLGVAYLIHNAPGREMVLRGGGGVFFDTGQQLGSLGPARYESSTR